MRRLLIAALLSAFPFATVAQEDAAVMAIIVEDHILPRFESLALLSDELALVASEDCAAESITLRTAYANTFDAWISASHLRLGPTEVDDRAFALAFWPDSRGSTPKTLNALIASQDPIATNVVEYAGVSIAARGFYALEFLLFDEALSVAGDDSYRCTLIQTIAADIAVVTAAISDDWESEYATRLLVPSETGTFRSNDEVLQKILNALSTGLQFTSETRLGRPLGTFDKPRPTRAEVWRSGRSQRHVMLSLQALRDLAIKMAADDSVLVSDLSEEFDRALKPLADIDDPIFASVADPQTRFKIEILQQSVDEIRTMVRDRLSPQLGVTAGFNALDGD